MSAATVETVYNNVSDFYAEASTMDDLLGAASAIFSARKPSSVQLRMSVAEVKHCLLRLKTIQETSTSDRTNAKLLATANGARTVLQDFERTLARVKENLPTNAKRIETASGPVLEIWFYLDPPTDPKKVDYSERNTATYNVLTTLLSELRTAPPVPTLSIVKTAQVNPTPIATAPQWSEAGETSRDIGWLIYQHPALGRLMRVTSKRGFLRELDTICTDLNCTANDVADVLEARNLTPKFQPTAADAIAVLLKPAPEAPFYNVTPDGESYLIDPDPEQLVADRDAEGYSGLPAMRADDI